VSGPSIREQFQTLLKKQLQSVYDKENTEINQLSVRQKKLDEHSVQIDTMKEKS